MAVPEKEPHIITTDHDEGRAIFSSLYIMGALDDSYIYEIVKPDGTKEQQLLCGDFRNFADRIIQDAYPGCVVTLLSSDEQAT